jgi:hypothetical protein
MLLLVIQIKGNKQRESGLMTLTRCSGKRASKYTTSLAAVVRSASWLPTESHPWQIGLQRLLVFFRTAAVITSFLRREA